MHMIEIKPNALYTRADLAEMLGPAGIDPDRFIARLKPRKVFRAVWYERDLLKAMDAAPALDGGDKDTPAPKNSGGQPTRKAQDARLDPLRRIIEGRRS